MNEEEIRVKIYKRLSPRLKLLDFLESEVNETESLIQSGILDSLSFLDFISELDEEFALDLDFGELDPSEFTSIVTLTQLIYSKLKDDNNKGAN